MAVNQFQGRDYLNHHRSIKDVEKKGNEQVWIKDWGGPPFKFEIAWPSEKRIA